MGKSNKKVKSDRINALRKQYDAFVEEDKKRKERNDYILGRLDKMRFCTTVVPVRRTIIPPINAPTAHFSEITMNRNLQPSVVPKSQLLSDIPKIEDNYLSEITKNFILIPKLRSSFMNNYLQPAPVQHSNYNADNVQHLHEMQQMNSSAAGNVIPNSNENDWKSKYEILSKLKNEELGNSNFAANSAPPSMILNNEMRLQNKNEKTTGQDLEAFPNSKYKYPTNELPEKDIPFENPNNMLKGKVLNAEDDAVKDIHYKLQNTNLESNDIEESNLPISGINKNYAEQEHNLQSTAPQELGEQKNDEENAVTQAYSAESNVPQLLEEQTSYEHQYTEGQEYNAESNVPQTSEERTNYVEYASAQAYSAETNDPQSVEEQTHYVEYGQAYHTDTNIPQPLEEQAGYVEYATEQEYNAETNIPHTSEEQNNYVNYAETINDGTLMPNLKCAEGNDNSNAYENTVNSVNLAGYTPEGHVEVVNSSELLAEINSGQTVLDSTSNDYIQYQNENVPVDGLDQQLQETVADNSEWNALEAEQGSFGAIHPQQSYDNNLTNQQQLPQFHDQGETPQPTNEEMPYQQMPENATENITENQTNIDVTGDIEAFEAEQREMFHSEIAAENNEQLEVGIPNQQEASYQDYQDYNYENNQSYNQINLGEDEEQTLRYDPAYSQQYLDTNENAYMEQKEIPSESYQQEDIEQPQHTEQK